VRVVLTVSIHRGTDAPGSWMASNRMDWWYWFCTTTDAVVPEPYQGPAPEARLVRRSPWGFDPDVFTYTDDGPLHHPLGAFEGPGL
jgi:hypothetical protein